MRVLLTGASGRLGQAACQVLHGAGLDVVATDHVYTRELPVPVRVVDLLDPSAMYQHLEGCDAVVHLGNHPYPAAVRPSHLLYQQNLAMNANVFRPAIEVGVKKLVFSSSIQAICGDRKGPPSMDRPSSLAYLPIDGDLPACPGNDYALSKQAGENMLRMFARMDPDLSATAIRFPLLWRGRAQGKPAPTWQLDPAHHRGNLDEGFAYLPMEDAATLVLAVVENAGPGYHQWLPAMPDPACVNFTPQQLREHFYAGVPLKDPSQPLTSLVDTRAITEAVGWAPTPAVPAGV